MTLFFCKSWFRAEKCPTEVWTEEKAGECHANGTLYTVLVGSIEHPICFLEIKNDFVGVSFLDDRLREYVEYVFAESSPEMLFLQRATHREYVGGTDKIDSGSTYYFKGDGSLVISRQCFNPHRLEKTTGTADVTENYSRKPDFGQYEDLIRLERS
ncbi:hypothetical protein J3P71_30790 (plasmid) [Rhizobium leguminosarum]|uniref:lytic transglycosylase n=1 Tax=Rhizobium leguminosarum TaxID=384 RepID=UPI001441FA52|nr:lytic transglycosylase [Rhizobium leguminosarum]MBY5835534.1 lytic transglycosylase [Rhizobium leguminosarum]NKM78171.1 lytic transglycosylase [Rhizobium leguminosarum bv. viciae]QSZ11624.1 hypothetical protein J3P71_30790 [Rhizobium leguminosarum]